MLGADDLELIGVEAIGTGQMSRVYRASYRRPGGEPESVAVKLAATDQNSRDVGVNLGAYLREVTFYGELRDRIGGDGTLAKCHLATHDPKEGWFTLVLEDVDDGVQGDQIAGCGPDEARIAMVALARIHAPVFGDLALAATDWLNQPNPLNQALLTALAARLPRALRRPHRPRARRGLPSASSHPPTPGTTDRRPPLGLVHGDYRLDNMLFHDGTCTVVDWQTLGLGPVMRDAAYFIGGALPVEERRAHEESLLRAYHDELLAQGVAGLLMGAVLGGVPAPVLPAPGDDDRPGDGGRADGSRRRHVHGGLRPRCADGDRPERRRAPSRAERGGERAASTRPRRRGHARARPRGALERELVLRRDQRRRSGSASTTGSGGCPTRTPASSPPASSAPASRRSCWSMSSAPLPPADDEAQAVDHGGDQGRASTACEPLERFRVEVEGTAAAHADHSAPLRKEAGEPVEIAVDLTWETDGVPYQWRLATRYEIPCRVSGTVRVGDEEFELVRPGPARSLVGRSRLVGQRLDVERACTSTTAPTPTPSRSRPTRTSGSATCSATAS